MEINPHAFKAYDIRGLYPEDVNEEVAYKTGLAYANFLKDAKKIVVGVDFRHSSPALKEALIEGLTDGGKDVVDIGEVPTPILYFGIAHYKYDGGIEITASHNAGEYNGIKLQKEKALPIYGENGIYDIRDAVLSNDLHKAKEKGSVETKEIVGEYMDYLVSKIQLKRSLKIVIDCGNGACGFIPEKIFKKLGCEVETIFGEPDGDFPNHIADPYREENMQDLKKKVLESGADIGIAFDGDGDRVGLIDKRGRIISGEHQLMLLYRRVLKEVKGKIVMEVRTSKVALGDIEKHGGEPVMAVAGHAYVLDSVFKEKAVFGGETTGHIYFPKHYYDYDDGIFTALKLAEVVAENEDFEKCIDELPVAFASKEYFVDCPDEEKAGRMGSLADYLRENEYDFLDIDGVRINFPNGWALARPSNTTPHIKCRMEGDTLEDLKDIEAKARELFGKFDINIEE
ncbi:phosphomannomutase/phosphoglucomutase [bacterium]|jgi:phosphomannomutase / phosphoglucomutase|nr:phosphomannomutase/phosphoglucomutase [bacterium]MBT4598199.1 phosphomannomutase/phosphoglucomutase [bacterium]MBT6753797.1 phosphomannomutase/phosphoglucomutase [bacterium]MBT7037490.1 phosphomannomutase/phosphoglucomutase [bacterium]MBT7432201.1 phosphomannomutase/phosphoglucomutase [bacterium]